MSDIPNEELFPSNSILKPLNNSQAPVQAHPKEDNIPIKNREGAVKEQKRTTKDKLREVFLVTDIKTMWQKATNDVLKPAAKETLYNLGMSVLGMSLYGDNHGIPTPGRVVKNGATKIFHDYTNDFIKSGTQKVVPARGRDPEPTSDFIFRYDPPLGREEANGDLGEMMALLDENGYLLVYQAYKIMGMNANYPQMNYGWTDLSDSYVRREGNSFLLHLPKPCMLTIR